MKKIISLLLCMVMIFSFAVPSFAIGDHDTELGALNSIDYYVYWMFQDFTEDLEDLKTWNFNSMNQLLDINDFTRSVYNELQSLNDKLFGDTSFLTPFATSILNQFTSLNDEFKFFSDSFFNGISWGEPFAEVVQNNLVDMVDYLYNMDDNILSLTSSVDNLETGILTLFGVADDKWQDYSDSWYSSIYNDVHQLKEVLADDEDLAFKESQKENQQYVQDNFFSSSSDLSLNLDDFGILTQYVREFKTGYNFEENIGNPLPLTLIDSESDFKDWFSDSIGQAMDPTFNGGSGGGGGETPDPGPDPDPDPPTPTIKNWLPLATTEPGGSEIYNGIGYKPDTRWSSSVGAPSSAPGMFLTGWIPISAGSTFYLYDFDFQGSYSSYVIYFKSDDSVISYNITSTEPDSNGVFSFLINDSSIEYFRITCGSITENSIISINQYPIQTASTFLLRAQSVPYVVEPEIVTSYYADRLLEVERIKGGSN